jgi:hypothetical protein
MAKTSWRGSPRVSCGRGYGSDCLLLRLEHDLRRSYVRTRRPSKVAGAALAMGSRRLLYGQGYVKMKAPTFNDL